MILEGLDQSLLDSLEYIFDQNDLQSFLHTEIIKEIIN